MLLSISKFLYPGQAPMLCKAVLTVVHNCYLSISKFLYPGQAAMLCKVVLTVVHNCYLFLYMQCLGGLHYNSLYAMSLHCTFACLQVPFSSGVSWNKRG